MGSICEDVVAELLFGTLRLVGSSGDLGLRTVAASSAAAVATALLASSSMVVTSTTHIEDEDGRWTLFGELGLILMYFNRSH
jgi:hypothetical protein